MSRLIQWGGLALLLLFVAWSVWGTVATSGEREVLAICEKYFAMFDRSHPITACRPLKAVPMREPKRFLVLVHHPRWKDPAWWTVDINDRGEVDLITPPDGWRTFLFQQHDQGGEDHSGGGSDPSHLSNDTRMYTLPLSVSVQP